MLHLHVNALGVILLSKSGVTWHNQTGGTGCYQQEVQGILVPLCEDLTEGLEEKLHPIVCDWAESYDLEAADVLLRPLEIQVDRSRLDRMQEAWIPVDVLIGLPDFKDLHACGGMKGWFVYNNCD